MFTPADNLSPSSLDGLSFPRQDPCMKSLVFVLLFTFGLPLFSKEHVILCGGPASRRWENLRVEKDRHDRWWANFVRASTMRIDEIRKSYGATAKITWIVYKNGYVTRGRNDGKPYTTWIAEQASKRKAKLVWISSGKQAISAINSGRDIITFDFFGHSNRHCFMLDYGSDVMAVSQAWIHERDLGKIFEEYTDNYEFVRTKTVVKLFAIGVRFVSRSEAKRLVRGLGRHPPRGPGASRSRRWATRPPMRRRLAARRRRPVAR